ncbi:MAG: T9SS type A sorting domain-containing protein [Bacteroidetes bacterium]|nr:T9SS type A sorting domain-containing protein [Bacteroidota bacterium]
MKKVSVLMLAIFSLTSATLFAQTNNKGWCLAHEEHLRLMATDPQYVKNQQALESYTRTFEANYKQQKNSQNPMASAVKIIPVVFHVIHAGGSENISDAQIKDQIRILNLDFRRLNTDTGNTPAPFQSLAADCQIEFRLAQLDPNGNCTSGIERINSALTFNARNNVKPLSVWPPNQYLNIWVVASIDPQGISGTVLGYAQFPGAQADPSTDGVVLRSNYTGSIGTAAVGGDKGRAATHEVGHWFNLIHIWGDDICGDDQVTDTPTQNIHQSVCPTFPSVDAACGNAPNGGMFSDYMDYTNGNCMNMFSIGQSARMNATLTSPISGRNNLWTASNLAATGVNNTPQLCTADFSVDQKVVCLGTAVTFTDLSWNAAPTSWQWDFDNDGTTDDITQNPAYTYTAAGTYSVKLTVSDGVSTKSATKTSYISVLANTASLSPSYYADFENASFPYNDCYVSSGTGAQWTRTTSASYSGAASLKLSSFSSTSECDVDAFITPAINMSALTSPYMSFKLSYAQRSSTDNNQLEVLTSTNCGVTWNQRYSMSGALLSTAGIKSTPFTPSSLSQWRQETVSFTKGSSIRFKFQFTSGGTGNNVYIDDINIGNTGIAEEFANGFDLTVFPNPFNDNATISFNILEKYNISVGVYDIVGREVMPVSAKAELHAGTYSLPLNRNALSPGVYFVKLNADGYSVIKKVIVQ